MAVHGEIETAEILGGFGSLDGIYLVDEQFCISYMSGIAMNLFRSIGLVADMRGSPISELEEQDEQVVSQAMQANCCVQTRHESEDGASGYAQQSPTRATGPFVPDAPPHAPPTVMVDIDTDGGRAAGRRRLSARA